jgi:hypothetical protein
MNIHAYFAKMAGRTIDFDGAYGFQCADVIRHFIEDKDGWNTKSYIFTPFAGNGKLGDNGVLDGFKSFEAGVLSIVDRRGIDKKGSHFEVRVIKNHRDLKEGDIVFFDIGKYGHAGIFTNLNKVPNKIEVFDQNSKGFGDACSWNNYDITLFAGALRKVIITAPTVIPMNAQEIALQKAISEPTFNELQEDEKNAVYNNSIDYLVARIAGLRRDINEIQSACSVNENQFKNKITELEKELEELKKPNKFNFNIASIDLARNGWITGAVTALVTTAVGYVVAKVPELEAYQTDIIYFLLALGGITVTSQNINNFVKNSNK